MTVWLEKMCKDIATIEDAAWQDPSQELIDAEENLLACLGKPPQSQIKRLRKAKKNLSEKEKKNELQ